MHASRITTNQKTKLFNLYGQIVKAMFVYRDSLHSVQSTTDRGQLPSTTK